MGFSRQEYWSGVPLPSPILKSRDVNLPTKVHIVKAMSKLVKVFPVVIPDGSEVKASACNSGDMGSIPGLGRSPGEGNGNPLPPARKESDTTE